MPRGAVGAPVQNPGPLPRLDLSRESVEYRIVRRRRRGVGVVVRRDGSVEALAPQRTSERRIREVVEEARAWIERKRAEMLARRDPLPRRRFEDGEDVPYLGDRLVLRVLPSPDFRLRDPVREGRTLAVTVDEGLPGDARRADVRRQVFGWLLERARDVFHERHVETSRRVGDAAVRIRIKDMSSRWGSCGPDRRMSLNWRLVLAPLYVIDYVLVHELAHIVEPNHSAAFWERVAGACPRHEAARRWLREHGESLVL